MQKHLHWMEIQYIWFSIYWKFRMVILEKCPPLTLFHHTAKTIFDYAQQQHCSKCIFFFLMYRIIVCVYVSSARQNGQGCIEWWRAREKHSNKSHTNNNDKRSFVAKWLNSSRKKKSETFRNRNFCNSDSVHFGRGIGKWCIDSVCNANCTLAGLFDRNAHERVLHHSDGSIIFNAGWKK